ncbi:MAG: DUF308 domain-containing protein [Candidatus Saccharibacteria bacterium]|nr:DUF308 domain-containing protein [Candidatus Saccharibacteria bacterium]
MEKIEKKVRSFIDLSIGTSVAFLVLGLIFLVAPDLSLDIIRWFFAIIALSAGLSIIIRNSMRQAYIFSGMTILGVMLVLIGMVFVFYPSIMSIFPILLGVWLIASAISSLAAASTLKSKNDSAVIIFTSIISAICGILLMANPWGGTMSIIMLAGIMMMIHAVANIIDLVVFRKNFNDLSEEVNDFVGRKKKEIKKKIAEATEAEVKEAKKTEEKKTGAKRES